MPGPDPNSAEDALMSLLSNIQAISPKDTRTTNVRGTHAVSTAQKMTEEAAKHRTAIEAPFKTSPFEQIDQLIPRAFALWAAEKRIEATADASSKLSARYAEAGELKTVAVKVLDLIAVDDPAVRKILDAIRPGTGYADRADDLTALHPHLDARKEKIISMGVMTEAQIDRIGVLGSTLLVQENNKEAADAATLLRNQAFTYFYAAWREVERHIDFVYFHDSEARAAYPSLYPHRPSKKTPGDPTI